MMTTSNEHNNAPAVPQGVPAQEVIDSIEAWKSAWLKVPPFADRVNKATREAKHIERLEGIAMGACFLLQKLRAEYGDDFGAGMTEQVNDCIRDAQQIANNVLQRERQALRARQEPTK